MTMKEVVPGVDEVIFTGVTEKDGVKAPRLLLTAVRATEPVNPPNGVIVKVIPVDVAPGFTVTLAAQGDGEDVSEKSLEETKSAEANVPSEARSVPLDPAKVASPE